MDQKRNIIPLFFKGFEFENSSVSEKLSGKLKDISRYNGLNVHEDYFRAAMDRLSDIFLNVPLEMVLHPVSTKVRRKVKEEKAAAEKAVKEKAKREAAEEKAEQERKEHERLEREANVREEKGKKAGKLYEEGVHAQDRKDYDEAEMLFRQSLQIAVELNDEQGKSIVLSQLVRLNQARLNMEQMEREAAEEKAEQERKKRERLEREEKTRKEKDAAEKAAREKTKREAEEKVKKERKYRERKEREEKTYKPSKITIGGTEFLRIPKGTFTMGDREEKHELDIPYDYFLARFPVTNQLFKKFADATYFIKEWGVSQWNKKIDHPVVNVTWHTAREYCNWLNQVHSANLPAGYIIRLPTEAEWEKAARGPEGRLWPWGNEFDKDKCNSASNMVVSIVKTLGEKTTPVNNYSPQGDSPYGIADMAGNVWEWTHSLDQPYPYKPDDGREKDGANESRILRGGAYDFDALGVSTVHRSGFSPDTNSYHFGFRVALAPPLPK